MTHLFAIFRQTFLAIIRSPNRASENIKSKHTNNLDGYLANRKEKLHLFVKRCPVTAHFDFF